MPFPRFGDVPPSASGRSRHDPLLGVAGFVVSGVWGLASLVRRPPPVPERDRTHELHVAERRVVAHDQDVVALTLAAADGKPLPRWLPGAHIDIHLPSGRVRQYSLNGDPAVRDSYRIAVRRNPTAAEGGSRCTTNSQSAQRSPPAARATRSHCRCRAMARRRSASGSSRAASGSLQSCRCCAGRSISASTGRWSMSGAPSRACPSSTRCPGTTSRLRSGPTTCTAYRPRMICWVAAPTAPPYTRADRRRCSAQSAAGWPVGTTSNCTPSGSPHLLWSTAGSSPCARVHGQGRRGRRRRDASVGAAAIWGVGVLLVPARVLRNLPNTGTGRRCRAPRHPAHRSRALRRGDARVCVAGARRRAGHAGSVGAFGQVADVVDRAAINLAGQHASARWCEDRSRDRVA